MKAADPHADEDIVTLQQQLRIHFSEVNLQQLQNMHNKTCHYKYYTLWIDIHVHCG